MALLRREGERGLVMLPLVVKGETLGIVELIADEPITLDERKMDLARTMANEAAINLGNAQLYVTARALADRDPLTGFYNHRYLHERLGEEILRAQRFTGAGGAADAGPLTTSSSSTTRWATSSATRS